MVFLRLLHPYYTVCVCVYMYVLACMFLLLLCVLFGCVCLRKSLISLGLSKNFEKIILALLVLKSIDWKVYVCMLMYIYALMSVQFQQLHGSMLTQRHLTLLIKISIDICLSNIGNL